MGACMVHHLRPMLLQFLMHPFHPSHCSLTSTILVFPDRKKKKEDGDAADEDDKGKEVSHACMHVPSAAFRGYCQQCS